MATVTLTLVASCSGGGHHTLEMTGDVTGARVYTLAEIDELVQGVGREELAAAILRLAKQGRTLGQLRTLLEAGITVTI